MQMPRLIEAFLRTEEKEAAVVVCSSYSRNGLYREAEACMARHYPVGLSTEAELILKVFTATLLIGFIVGVVRCLYNNRHALRCMYRSERITEGARWAVCDGLTNVVSAAKVFGLAFAILLGFQVLFA